MLILVPPSEGKATAGDGPPLDLDRLCCGALNATRSKLIDALTKLCEGPRRRAVAGLGLSAGLADEIDRNRALRTAATLPAGRLYTGVLYDALDLPGMDAPAARRAADDMLIFSALWGLLRLDDRIPPYRLSMTARLPAVAGLPATWRPVLNGVLPPLADGRLVVDLRSTSYAAAWRPAGELAGRTVGIRVLRERVVAGERRRTVVSHMAKATRGAIAGALLRSGARPDTPDRLADVLTELGYRTEPAERPRPGGAASLDVILTEDAR